MKILYLDEPTMALFNYVGYGHGYAFEYCLRHSPHSKSSSLYPLNYHSLARLIYPLLLQDDSNRNDHTLQTRQR